MTETSKIYVASSWRNHLQGGVVHTLRAAGFDVYDFKNPPNGSGFHWSEVGLQRNSDTSHVEDYLTALEHPRSVEDSTPTSRPWRQPTHSSWYCRVGVLRT